MPLSTCDRVFDNMPVTRVEYHYKKNIGNFFSLIIMISIMSN